MTGFRACVLRHTPDAISLKEAGENEDRSILGICLYHADVNMSE